MVQTSRANQAIVIDSMRVYECSKDATESYQCEIRFEEVEDKQCVSWNNFR